MITFFDTEKLLNEIDKIMEDNAVYGVNDSITLTAKEKAKDIFNNFYFILFDSDSDKGEEILVSSLAQKNALLATDIVIDLLEFEILDSYESTPEKKEKICNLYQFWKDVKKEINKM
jgi:hypothetical protein